MYKFTSLDQFTLLPNPDPSRKHLGQGSYGIVKLAEFNLNKERYALKIVDLKRLQSSEIEIINREIRLHSKCDHPNIIRILGSFKEGQSIVIVLEFAENGNLYHHLRKKRKLEEQEAWKYFTQTAQAIAYLHKIDILHRDIKPENLLLDKHFNIKLCDFGWSTDGINLRRTTFCGTYEYMSPEVAFKRPYTENIDVWSLGVLLYEMTHGYSVFKAKTLNDVTSNLKNIEKIHLLPELSSEVKSLIQGILRFDPEKRLNLQKILSHDWIRGKWEERGGRRREGGRREDEGKSHNEEGCRREQEGGRKREEGRKEEEGGRSRIEEGGKRQDDGEWMSRKMEETIVRRKEEEDRVKEEIEKKRKQDGWLELFLGRKEEGRRRVEEGRRKEEEGKSREEDGRRRGEKGKRREEDGEREEDDLKVVSNILKERNRNYIQHQSKVSEEEKEFSKPFSKPPSKKHLYSYIALNQNKENLEAGRKDGGGRRREEKAVENEERWKEGSREEGRREEEVREDGRGENRRMADDRREVGRDLMEERRNEGKEECRRREEDMGGRRGEVKREEGRSKSKIFENNMIETSGDLIRRMDSLKTIY